MWLGWLAPFQLENDKYLDILLLKYSRFLGVLTAATCAYAWMLGSPHQFMIAGLCVIPMCFGGWFLVKSKRGKLARIIFLLGAVGIHLLNCFRHVICNADPQPVSLSLLHLLIPMYLCTVFLEGASFVAFNVFFMVEGCCILMREPLSATDFYDTLMSAYLLVLMAATMVQQHFQMHCFLDHTKTSYEQLRATSEKIQDDLARRTKFLYNMSHEIRNPLYGIVGSLDIIDGSADVPAKMVPQLETIRICSTGLVHLVNNVLDWGKACASKEDLKLYSVPFSVPRVVDQALDTTRWAANNKNLDVSLEVEEIHAMGDPSKVRQILANLLSNSFKFTRKGWIRVRVRVGPADDLRGLEVPSGKIPVVFEVSDSGVGISDSLMERLFVPFAQDEDAYSCSTHTGSGLGLSIVKLYAEAMGGTVRAAPGPNGVGTVVTVILMLCPPGRGGGDTCGIPAVRAVISTESELAAELEAELGSRRDAHDEDDGTRSLPVFPIKTDLSKAMFKHMTVLVADDSSINRRVTSQLLKSLGAQVVVACDGKEAVFSASLQAFSLILMDLDMPVMNGQQATMVIRTGSGPCSSVPIIALTGATSALPMGMDDVVLKPVSRRALAEVLSKHGIPLAPAADGPPGLLRSRQASTARIAAFAEKGRRASDSQALCGDAHPCVLQRKSSVPDQPTAD